MLGNGDEREFINKYINRAINKTGEGVGWVLMRFPRSRDRPSLAFYAKCPGEKLKNDAVTESWAFTEKSKPTQA